MSIKPRVRIYRGADSSAIQTTDDVLDSAERDATELEAYGINEDTRNELRAARDAFSDNATDEELMGNLVIATQAKNTTRTDLRQQIRQVADRARYKYGEEDGRYRKFGVEGLSRLKDDELLRCARRVVRVGTEFLADLASTGLTAPILATLLATANTFDEQIDAQHSAIKERDLAVDTRIALGNEMYRLLVSLAGFGKLCWGDTNEAKYNDYVLTHTTSGSHATEGNIDGGAVVGTSVTGIDENTVVTLKNTGSAPLRFYFAANPQDPEGAVFAEVAPNNSQDRSAEELGYSQQQVRLNVHNVGGTAGSYRVEWDE